MDCRQPAGIEISPGEVHIWYARDEEISEHGLLAGYLELLSEEERAQQRRFFFPKHRHQYLITRVLVRCVLSLYVDAVPPQAWQFGKTRHNKPYIASPSLPLSLNFNLSHTEKLIVLAVVLDGDIGVDAEFLAGRNAGLDIAQKYFTPGEVRDLLAVPVEQRQNRFFDLWTLKEAYIKACGLGLAVPLDHFGYSFSEPGKVRISFDPIRNDDPRYWNLWQIKPSAMHTLGLAVHSKNAGSDYLVSMHETVPLRSIRQVHYPIISKS